MLSSEMYGDKMIISEKQILKLIRIADGYCVAMHRFGEYKNVEIVQNLLETINNQQSKELKEITNDNR